jgi:hypothetical protein
MADAKTGSAEPKKSNTLLYALIGGGSLLLLACCCTGACGVGGYYYVIPKLGQAAIVGVWREGAVEFDFRADGKLKRGPVGQKKFDLVYKFVDAKTIEIGPDKVGEIELNGKPYPTIRYHVAVTPDTLTLTEATPPPQGAELQRYVLKRQ